MLKKMIPLIFAIGCSGCDGDKADVEEVVEVNAEVYRDCIIPTISFEKTDWVLAIPCKGKEVIQLDPVSLDRPIEELLIKTLNFTHYQGWLKEKVVKSVEIPLPEGFEIPVSKTFYTWRRGASAYLREELLQVFPNLGQKPQEAPPPPRRKGSKIEEAIKTFGFSVEDVKQANHHDRISMIKRAYREMMKKCHPDVNPGPEATEISKEINNAYDLLKGGIEFII